MSYTPTKWKAGDTITSAKLNKMETAIEELSNVEPAPQPTPEPSEGLSDEAKAALLQCFKHTVYDNQNGKTYYNALRVALDVDAAVESITAAFTQGSLEVYEDTPLDDLKPNIIVKAIYEDDSEVAVSDYTLSGTLSIGTSTVKVTYNGFKASFDVDVIAKPAPFPVYKMSDGTLGDFIYGSMTTLYNKVAISQYYKDGSTYVANKHGIIGVNSSGVQPYYVGHDKSMSESAFTPTSLYPVPVPEGTTEVQITVVPNTFIINGTLRKYADGIYNKIGDAVNIAGSVTFDVDDSESMYVACQIKDCMDSNVEDVIITFS